MIKAGFSRVDVTPPLGSYLSGYYYPRFAKGVLDPIQLNAIACNDGEQTVLLIIADFIGVDRYYCDVIREKIAERVPTTRSASPDLIFINESYLSPAESPE